MKPSTVVLIALVVLALAVPAWAGDQHVRTVIGTVTRVDGAHITLKTTAGKTQVVMLDRKTVITRGKDTADASAIVVGQRVSVDARPDQDMLMAQAIKLAVTKK
jgi:hypothetical protein